MEQPIRMWKHCPGSSCCVPGPHLNFCPRQGHPERETKTGCSPCFSALEAFPAVWFTPQGKVTLAGWLATNLLILPGCKFCNLVTELKDSKTLQGEWTIPPCFPNAIPLPCTEFFIHEGNQMFQSQTTVYCLVLKLWVRLGGYMCDFRHRSLA